MTTQPGALIANRFRIDRLLGKGGYGEVWEATQLSVDRKVALKVLAPAAQAHEEARRRFEREARLAARVRHTNAVRVIDFGEDDGSFFLVMELVRGPSLKERLRAVQRLPVIDAARIGGRIAAALGAAHRLGLVHRDLKPANVILTEIDGEEQPVVIDFGLAKLFEDDDDGTHITRSNVMVGTPAYMAPEVVKGETVDQRTDLYALGVVIYEMITGQVPLRGKTPVETATRQVTDEAPPLALRPELGVPPALVHLVASLLAKSPAQRPPDAETAQDVLFAVAGLSRSGRMPAVHAATAPAEPSAVSLQTVASGSVIATSSAELESLTDPTVRVPPPLPWSRPPDPPADPSAEDAVPGSAVGIDPGPVSPAPAAAAAAAMPSQTRTSRKPAVVRMVVAAALLAMGVTGLGIGIRQFAGEVDDGVQPDSVEVAAAQATTGPEASPAVVLAVEGSAPAAEAIDAVAPARAAVATAHVRADGAAVATAVRIGAEERTDVPSHGWLTITVEPRGEIWVDGERLGETVLSRHRIEPGEYAVEARRGDAVVREAVEVEAGEHARVRLRVP